MKGDGEAHPFLSPNDEFADYETWDKGNLDGSVAKKKEMLEFEYARSALQERPQARGEARHQPLQVRPGRQQRRAHRPRRLRGGQLLRQDHAAGAQPASPDRHLHGQPEDRREDHGLGGRPRPATPPSGPRRTRASRSSTRWQRKETYATTGSRMVVRFFGGWDFEAADARLARARASSATPRACRWAATSPTRPRASRRPSSSPR